MPRSSPILIVDDDPKIREVVRYALGKEGFETVEAENGAEALEVFRLERPGLIILDILMPEMDGTDVCRTLRKESRVPIIFLSSRDDEIDRILGLELGGDDYVTKPFSPRELVARVRAVLRRLDSAARPETAEGAPRVLRRGKLTLDLDRFQVRWDDREIVLTVTEFGLLRSLLEYPGKVYTREQLMERAYAYDNVVSGRTIDSHIRRVRSKLAAAGGDPIETVHGLGYKIGSCD